MALKTFDDLYPGRFLKAGNLQGRNVTLTIASVQREGLVGDDGKEQQKATMLFRETQMGVVLCKTNGICIRAMFGDSLANWEGKRITLMPDVWNGEPCIRIAGSPDIPKDITVTVTLPRRKPFTRKLTVTRTAAQPAAQPPKPAEREPGEEG